MEKFANVRLPVQAWQSVIDIIGELPTKTMSYPLMMAIKEQVEASLTAPIGVTPSTAIPGAGALVSGETNPAQKKRRGRKPKAVVAAEAAAKADNAVA